jgi:hypothetical protein
MTQTKEFFTKVGTDKPAAACDECGFRHKKPSLLLLSIPLMFHGYNFYGI